MILSYLPVTAVGENIEKQIIEIEFVDPLLSRFSIIMMGMMKLTLCRSGKKTVETMRSLKMK